MAAFVVDVNVAITANGRHKRATALHRLACIQALRMAREGIICVDSDDHILKEYRNNLSMSGQPGPGDEFMYWIHQNQHNEMVCERVCIPECTDGDLGFEHFPEDPDLRGFDPSDRKYVAVALGSANSPEILNATDPDWWHFREALSRNGVRIRFLCPELMEDSTTVRSRNRIGHEGP